jgi:peptidoglycan biosynthesis protein MviN/MurJ (putative lipid II flippase)
LVGASLYKTLPLVDRALAGLAPSGGLTIFNLAQSGVGAIASVLERSVCLPITANFGRYVAEKRFGKLRSAYRSSVAKISLLTIIYIVVMLIGKSQFEYVVTAILKTPPSISESLWWLCISLVGYLHAAASGTLVVSAIQAFGDTKTPVKIGAIGFLLSLPLKVVGFYLFGLSGITLVSSVHYLANLALMIVCCEKKISYEGVKHYDIK